MKEWMVYINGKFVPESEAKISIFDAGFTTGEAITEVTRTFKHKPFKLEDHIKRLYRSLKMTGIDPGMNPEEMTKLALEVLKRNFPLMEENDDCCIVHNITAGERGYPYFGGGSGSYTVVIYCVPVEFRWYAKQYKTGIHLVTPINRMYPTQCLDPKIKHRSRMYARVAELQAKLVDPDARALLLDLDGNIAEGTGFNFFIVTDGVLRTPKTRNILAGISRATVLQLAQKLNIPAVEEDLQPYHVYNADEAFYTSTSPCTLPVTKFNGEPIGNGKPGPITKRLLKAWSDMVGVDIVKQALDYIHSP